DSVDNVPGVAGIGEKTAAKLLQEFGTLDKLLANIDKVAGAKKQENLRAAIATIPLRRQLVKLDAHMPLDISWDAWRVQPWDANRLIALFREWGFRSFQDQVRQATPELVSAPSAPIAPQTAPERIQGELFPFGSNTVTDGESQNASDQGPVTKDTAW